MNVLTGAADVFVIGGGPAGLAAAIAARQRGFSVTVADSSVPPIDKACGEGIMPDGVAAARSLGLVLEQGHPFDGISFWDHTGGTPAHVESPFPSGQGIAMRRTALHQLMVDRAMELGVDLAWGVNVSGIEPGRVVVGGRNIRARWIVGADGGLSRVRRWAGLDRSWWHSRRFGFRRHYAVEPWSRFMEIYWGDGCQLYVTPVGPQEVCVVLLSPHAQLRLDDVLPQFPMLARRLTHCRKSALVLPERGGVSASRRLHAVYRGNVALVGDASGSVDAITGEGLCLLFQQAVALAGAFEAGDLNLYRCAHRRIGRRPEWMAALMLQLANHGTLRRRVLGAMTAHPSLFAGLLAMHVGENKPHDFFTSGLSLGWRMLTL